MTDKSKFEQMLEKLVSDDRAGAEEIFHDIVVEKSRSIYEGILENDIKDIEVEETSKEKSTEEETTEASKKEDEQVEEASEETSEEASNESKEEKDEEDEEKTDESFVDVANSEVAPAEAHGGDATDAMISDIEAPADAEGDEDKQDNDDSEKDEEEIEDRVVDLEDAIDDLKAEFEKMMGQDKDEPADQEDDAEEGDEESKEDESFVSQDAEIAQDAIELGDQPAVESKSNAPKTASEEIREYVNKVAVAHKDGSDNSKSPVAGKNNMGGTAKNLVQGGEEKGSNTPKSTEDNAGNINVPGGKVKLTAAPKAKTKAEDDKSSKKSILGS